MEKITLAFCTKGLTDEGWYKIISAIVTMPLASAYIFLRYQLDAVSIIGVAALNVMIAILCIWQRKRDRKIKAENIYVVEDVFLRVDVKRSWSRYNGWEEWCAIHFAHHGTFEVVMPKQKEPENPSCNYSAVHFSQPGDAFYLLMLRDGEEGRILRCFHQRYYVLSMDDFVLEDGEYHPKRVNK